MRAFPVVILAGVLAALFGSSAARAEVQRSHLGVVYSDAEERFSVRFPKEWDEVDSRIVRQLVEGEDFWPYDTAVLYLDLDRERYTCPCVWLARLPNRSLEMDLVADLSADVYETASLEKVAGSGRVPPLHESRYNLFLDADRDVVWGWADGKDEDGDRWREVNVYVPTADGTLVIMYTATPNMFDFYVPKVIEIIDTAEVHWTPLERVGLAVEEAISNPTSLATPEARSVLLIPGALVLAAVLGAGGWGWRARGAGFAVRCALATAFAAIGLLALLPEIVKVVPI